ATASRSADGSDRRYSSARAPPPSFSDNARNRWIGSSARSGAAPSATPAPNTHPAPARRPRGVLRPPGSPRPGARPRLGGEHEGTTARAPATGRVVPDGGTPLGTARSPGASASRVRAGARIDHRAGGVLRHLARIGIRRALTERRRDLVTAPVEGAGHVDAGRDLVLGRARVLADEVAQREAAERGAAGRLRERRRHQAPRQLELRLALDGDAHRLERGAGRIDVDVRDVHAADLETARTGEDAEGQAR